MLSFKLLWRNWRSGEVKILAMALVLAVAVVSCISIFTNRLEQALVQQSHTFLAADRVVRSSAAIPLSWIELSHDYELQWARTTSFSSMLFADDKMHLGSVKAVTDSYPLRGKLKISQVPFAIDAGDLLETTNIPAAGEAWVDSRLLSLLSIELGDQVYVGEKSLIATQLLISEPDSSTAGPAFFGARLLMNEQDLGATQVIQPGSRIDYQLLLSGAESRIDAFLKDIELSPHQSVRSIDNTQESLAKTLNKARDFLLLAAIVGVLLAGVAIAIAARHFASRQVDQVALLKSMGASLWQVRRLYAGQLLTLAVFATLAGLLMGLLLQQIIVQVLVEMFPIALPVAHWTAYLSGALTGVVCLAFFVVPPLWSLPLVPPIKVLRREISLSSIAYYWQGLLGLVALMILVAMLSTNINLTLAVISTLFLLVILVTMASHFLLFSVQKVIAKGGSIWRLAMASLLRHRRQSVVQIMVFSVAIMLLLTLTSLRTTLIDDWQQQLPPGTPNHFFMNIAEHEAQPVAQLLRENSIDGEAIYPMIRARLTHIRGELPSSSLRLSENILRREANLSWSKDLPKDNKIIHGSWWDEWQSTTPVGEFGVSVERNIAEKLNLSVGDSLSFSVGGLTLDTQVASVRELSWESMTPNFYFLLSPGALDNYSPSYLTSAYIGADKKPMLSELLQAIPTIVVLEMDLLIAQIQAIVKQVSYAVELVLWLILVGGFLVMWAAVNASMDERKQESALLRALGSPRRLLLGSLWLEFTILGGASGLLGAAASQGLLAAIQHWVFNNPVTVHMEVWGFGIVGGALAIGIMGVLTCSRVVTTPPGIILREVSA